MSEAIGDLKPPERILLGPGPSNVHPRVLKALSTPVVGHLDPAFLSIMDDTMGLLRAVFKTENRLTIPISGTGSAGMEAALGNMIEPGDTVVIGVNGLFGERMSDVSSRYGAQVISVPGDWGRPLDPGPFKKVLASQKRVKLVAVVHGETSTGVRQPVEEIGSIAKQHDALFLVDTVTSLAGVDVRVDDWGIDICYSGTQKCLSCPPGLAPITLSDAAVKVLTSRRSKVQSWYLDLTMIQKYWGSDRVYHHTAPISMVYALREALRLVVEEGLEKRFARHHRNSEALRFGVKALGLKLLVPPGFELDPLTTVLLPDGVQDLPVRQTLLNEFGIEVGGGLGPLKGKVWRIGLMGHSSTPGNVFTLLSALERVLPRHGFEVARGRSLDAAQSAYDLPG